MPRSFEFIKRLAAAWSDDHCSRKAAALAYYTAFSLAPTLVIVLWLVGFVVDAAVATEELRAQLVALVGPTAADAIDALLKHTQEEARSLTAIAIAFPVLLVGATTAFSDPLSLTIHDPDHSDDEDRFILLGASEGGRMLVVVHAERGRDRIRIISARPATRRERKYHEEGI